MADTAVVKADAPLDDLMMAMDVVDTLRHGETLVERELQGDARRAKMIERLREIYAGQGITVPDRILQEGVDALEQGRFVYKPRQGGFSFTLARFYVRRGVILPRIAVIGGAILAVILAWYFLIQAPASRNAEATRIELSETIPAQLPQLVAAIRAEANDPAVVAAAELTARDGAAAAAAGNADAARTAVASLEATLAELRLVFEVRVVSRPNEDSGTTRIFGNNTNENFYLIVEAIGPNGTALPRSVTSEEDQSTRTVTRWGVRVPESLWESVAADKRQDGIVQASLLGRKERGDMTITWSQPVQSGAITSW